MTWGRRGRHGSQVGCSRRVDRLFRATSDSSGHTRSFQRASRGRKIAALASPRSFWRQNKMITPKSRYMAGKSSSPRSAHLCRCELRLVLLWCTLARNIFCNCEQYKTGTAPKGGELDSNQHPANPGCMLLPLSYHMFLKKSHNFFIP